MLKFYNKKPNSIVLSIYESKSFVIYAYMAKLLKKYTNTISAIGYVVMAAYVLSYYPESNIYINYSMNLLNCLSLNIF